MRACTSAPCTRPCDVILSLVILLTIGVRIDCLKLAKPEGYYKVGYSWPIDDDVLENMSTNPHRSIGPMTPDLPVLIHHLRYPSAWRVLNKHYMHDMRPIDDDMEMGETPPRLFCWSFVKPPEDDGPEPFVHELKALYSSSCAGWAIYSNYDDPALGITKGHDGPTGKSCQNGVQFHSLYDKMVRDPSMDDYDWYIMLDADVWGRFEFLQRVLRKEDDHPVWTNYFQNNLFNRKFLQKLRSNWDKLNKRREDGCPIYSEYRHDLYPTLYPRCPQDVIFAPENFKLEGVHGSYLAFRTNAYSKMTNIYSAFFELQWLEEGWTTEARQLEFACELVGQTCQAEPLCCPPQGERALNMEFKESLC